MPNENVVSNVVLVPVSRVVHSRSYSKSQRLYDDEVLNELTESIRDNGICQPLAVSRESANGFYMVIDGDHRLEAARKANLESIPVIIDESVTTDDDSVEANVKNYLFNKQRVNLSFAESARILKDIENTLQKPSLIAKARSRLGLTKANLERMTLFNNLDEQSQGKLEKSGLDTNTSLIKAVLGIENLESREDYLDRALDKKDEMSPADMVAFLTNAKTVSENFSRSIQSHFNGSELPLTSTNIVRLLSQFDGDEQQLSMVDRLNSISDRDMDRVAGDYLRLITGSSADGKSSDMEKACPEMKQLVVEPEFPTDRAVIDGIIAFHDVFPADPDKRLSVVNSLLKQNKLSADNLVRISNNIEKSLSSYPEEIQEKFFVGELPFSDYVFSALDLLMGKQYDLSLKLDMIEKAASGKFLPEQFQTRLNKAIRDQDELRKDIVHQVGGDPKKIRNSADAIRSIGLSEEEQQAMLSLIGGDSRSVKNAAPAAAEAEAPFDEFENEDDEEVPEMEPAADEISPAEERVVDTDYGTLADSMYRANGSAGWKVELELLQNHKGASMAVSSVYKKANKICEKCRKERTYDFEVLNYCAECKMAELIGEIEDSVGDID